MSVEIILFAHTHTHIHTQAPAHTSILTIQNFMYTQLKTGSRQRLETDEDSSTERKIWLYIVLGKINVLRFDLNESPERVSVEEEGDGHSM